MVALILIGTVSAIMLLTAALSKFFIKKEIHRKPIAQVRYHKYLIPKSFWDDVNRVDLAIYGMGYDELEIVSFMIDQFCDKYNQIADHRVFQNRVATMMTLYQERKKWIMSKKVYNHQNQ